MNSVHHDSMHSDLLTEQQLKHMSRHSEELVPQTIREQAPEDDINKLKGIFNAVFQAAENQEFNTSQRVAAWNTLCALIDQCLNSQYHATSNFVWSYGVWNRAFALYIDHSHNARPKSSKQLLATLSAGLRGKHDHPGVERSIVKRLLRGILTDEDHIRTKSCLQALTQFLSKEVLQLRELLSCLDELRRGVKGRGYTGVQDVLYILLQSVSKGDLGSVVGQAVSAVLDKSASRDLDGIYFEEDTHADRQAIWVRPLELVVKSNAVSVEQLRIHILPTLFKREVSEYIHFLHRHGLRRLDRAVEAANLGPDKSQAPTDEILFAALQSGKETGLLYECENSMVSRTSSTVLIPVRFIGRLLSLSSRRARLTGLSLLITSHAATRSFPNSTLRLLKRHLRTFFADTDANFRSEVFSLMQKLMDRFRAITAVLARTCASHSKSDTTADSSASATLDSHRSFLEWLLSFLGWELRPTTSYQRHISSLKTLSIVSRSGLDNLVRTEYLSKSALAETKWPFHLPIMTPGMRRLLLDLLLNPFEDVRQVAASILTIYIGVQSGDDQLAARRELADTVNRAEDLMLLTGRADQADGVALSYALLYKQYDEVQPIFEPGLSPRSALITHLVESLEHMLSIAKSNLATAVNNYPMHGLLTSLRYLVVQNDLLPGFEGLLTRLVTCLHEVWNIVKPVLCNDAPEGYLPDEAEDIPDISTKDTLSYCWRALKEGSLLLEAVVSKGSPSSDTLLSLGMLCFTQLAELRHRGAFSTVAHTWITCCVKCIALDSEGGKSPVHLWYDRVLHMLANKTTINTRRSAGLPALFCGLLISDKTGALVSRGFNDLSIIARQPVESAAPQESSLPQVHALNCIKEILKSTRLREHSERYIPQSFRLAASSLRSQAWAIRNCGLMLFRAVIDRLLGTNDAYLENETSNSHRLTLPQHQDLLDIILDLLALPEQSCNNVQSNTNEGVFPALQLLQRMHVPEDRSPRAIRRVLALTASTSWHIRDKAARTYAALVKRDSIVLDIQRRLDIAVDGQNALHVAFLVVRYLVHKLRASRFTSATTEVENALRNETSPAIHHLHACISALYSASHLYHDNDCPVTKAAYLDIVNEVSEWEQTPEGPAGQGSGSKAFQPAQLNILEELERTLDAKYSESGDAALRTALARAFGVQIYTRANELLRENMLSLITLLGRTDADACCSFFRAFFEYQPYQTCDSNSASNILLHACSDILSGDFDMNLKCEIQRLLLDFAERHPQRRIGGDDSELFVKACAAASSPFSRQSNHQYVDQWLQLQAVAFEYCFRVEQCDLSQTSLNIANWIKHWCFAIQGRSIFSREAAAIAISRSRLLWQYVSDTNLTHFCQLCFGVYDLLNDDDEWNRLLASRTASYIVRLALESSFDGSLEPIEANQKLVKFMVHKWNEDAHFLREAFVRAFDMRETGYVSVADQLVDFEPADNALFAEEKQNLFLDDAREAKLWSQAILNVKATSIPKSLLRRLAQWVSDGLDNLTHKAQLEVDGALGWSTKPETFTLGFQVIYGAEVLLHVVERGVRLPIRPSGLRLKLSKFSTVATTRGINPLWVREIDRVMTSAVVGQLRRCSRIMDGIASVPI